MTTSAADRALGPDSDEAAATPAVLRAMRVILHVSFAGLLGLAVGRFLIGASWPGALWPLALSVMLGLAYLSGTVAEHRAFLGVRPRARPASAGVWLAAVLVLWCLLALRAPDFSWVVFPLFFVVQAVLPTMPSLIAVAGLTAVVIATQALHAGTGGFGTGQVIGPVLGAVFAVIAAWAYRALWRDAQRHRRTVVALQAAREELAHREHRAGVLAERDRLSREIHDTLAQGLASIVLFSRAAQDSLAQDRPDAAAEQLQVLESTASADLAEARRFVQGLASPRLAAGLESALRDLVDGLQGRAESAGTDLSVSLRVEGEPRDLEQATEAVLLRAAQTCLSNVETHARASRAAVTLAYWPETVTLDVVDDGVGFDAAAPHRPGRDGGYGLPHLRRRARELGGRLSIESRPGAGTAAALQLPAPVARPSTPQQPSKDRDRT
ncbi:two-component sensor histidine kinase [Kocuria sp. NBRC 114282]|uniref:sensor histidine kinase n=1 Tax=Kocuria sp. NBRC 114282 TaxID=2994520 RepID=UPI0024A38CC4|nr:sensor histidine kinase [Kocuria sp. NBRC 114282]GLU87525.1 two-component sensor histidine kinase [Kocuria sp. NBRC 114282]